MKLSYRLETIASFVRKGSKIADIGTDHGYVPIHLAKQGITAHALAMDVREGPLKRARAHIREAGLERSIETRLSDGLEALKPGEADTVIIAGMGGNLVIHILEAGKGLWESVERWVLSPQSDIDQSRRFLEENGFCIIREVMILEDGKYYTVMEAEQGEMRWEKEIYYRYGKLLIDNRDPALFGYLRKEQRTLEEIARSLGEQAKVSEKGRDRLAQLLRELELNKEAQHEMQGDY